jgi:hypothetical protein
MRYSSPVPRTQAIIIIAVMLLLPVLLSACNNSTASVGATPTSQPTTLPTATTSNQSTPTATPTPTPVPISSCTQVSGFGSAGPISTGSHFSEVGFPANTVGFIQQTSETNSYQFRIISACTRGATAGYIRAYFSAGLPPSGFTQSLNYPYQGNPNSACGDLYCWYKGTAHPSFQASRYISLENVTGVGSVVTYNLRLGITPLVFNNITIKGTYDYDFDLVDLPDAKWAIISGPQRQMQPENGATLANIGVTNFANVTYAQLTGLSYSTTPIDGNADTSNKLYPGVVWAVHTDSGHYVKVLVDGYGIDGNVNDITVNYVLYDFTF